MAVATDNLTLTPEEWALVLEATEYFGQADDVVADLHLRLKTLQGTTMRIKKVRYQVVAVYPSGNTRAVRLDPYPDEAAANEHLVRCVQNADPEDDWIYKVVEV